MDCSTRTFVTAVTATATATTNPTISSTSPTSSTNPTNSPSSTGYANYWVTVAPQEVLSLLLSFCGPRTTFGSVSGVSKVWHAAAHHEATYQAMSVALQKTTSCIGTSGGANSWRDFYTSNVYVPGDFDSLSQAVQFCNHEFKRRCRGCVRVRSTQSTPTPTPTQITLWLRPGYTYTTNHTLTVRAVGEGASLRMASIATLPSTTSSTKSTTSTPSTTSTCNNNCESDKRMFARELDCELDMMLEDDDNDNDNDNDTTATATATNSSNNSMEDDDHSLFSIDSHDTDSSLPVSYPCSRYHDHDHGHYSNGHQAQARICMDTSTANLPLLKLVQGHLELQQLQVEHCSPANVHSLLLARHNENAALLIQPPSSPSPSPTPSPSPPPTTYSPPPPQQQQQQQQQSTSKVSASVSVSVSVTLHGTSITSYSGRGILNKGQVPVTFATVDSFVTKQTLVSW